MSIPNVNQPEILQVDDTIRLRKFDRKFTFAYDWYLDEDAMYLMDGERAAYPAERVERMYRSIWIPTESYISSKSWKTEDISQSEM